MSARQVGAVAACAVGAGIAAYLALVELTAERVPLLCTTGGVVNCGQVLTSGAAHIGPVPVAVLGVVWFLGMLGLVARGQWDLLTLGWSGAGMAFVLYLIYAELFLIGAICLWCTVVHLLVFGLFLVSLDGYLAGGARPVPEAAGGRETARGKAR
ncbi:MAG: vitamin K epoxide reductase family protein [Chloroflexi bacterium]|nr:vitamin K epoxide reductase family protein [Chloroflexota bacterium]